ncbi:hypothetical protein A3L04_02765 [Thermococcus chitonophagus]|uniref:CRISPR-associated RAMP Cmr2 n=1 Tax=Thermococcus chitonophagus TaxID=54262 RepID=A0A170SEC2_9EURY|nr:type III-B CRISPR-associated protein Cas10/Cmr2 [Thermococcus chitonophagus]ASJ16075.1 hypothetical protein A3L04_02765 [Thermococcus chitonophagus]CUX77324.1 CRISPR-associated RAMP Cmr2 [Thermococcus chitonophagus]
MGRPWEVYSDAFLEVAPSRILGYLLGLNDLPEEWKKLSSYSPKDSRTLTKFVLKHPISTKEKELVHLSKFWRNSSQNEKEEFLNALRKAEDDVVNKLKNAGSMEEFAKLWNNLPKMLKDAYEKELKQLNLTPEIAGELVNLPADPFVPDHDWLSRLDIYAQLKAGNGEATLVRFKLSPVQGFIGNARTERDLWAGSHILSFLTYLAISRLWRKFGPNAIIVPHLRGQPFFEHELKILKERDKLDIANMPNKVLAIVPGTVDVNELEEEVRNEIRGFLEKLFQAAWSFYKLGDIFEEDPVYNETVRNYFSITVEAFPLSKTPGIESALRKYLSIVGDSNEIHYYSEVFAILDQLTDFKSVEHFPPEQPKGFKCTLCGENLAVGGRDEEDSVKHSWNTLRNKLRSRRIYDIKENERLCPLCLVKRFYPRFYSLWKADYLWVEQTAEGISERVDERSDQQGPKGFMSVSEVAMRRVTEKSLDRFNKDELFVTNESGSKVRPVTWYDIFLHQLFYTGARSEWRGEVKPPKFGGSTKQEFEGILAQLAGYLRPLFQGLEPDCEVLYKDNLRSEDAVAKVFGVDRDSLPSEINFEDLKTGVSKLEDLVGEPPKYYGLLKMDGDNMGKLLSGTKSVKDVGEYTLAGEGLGVKRPSTPTVHVAITRSLSNFAVNHVPKISKDYGAELLYAGGDDVFAVAPTDTVFSLAYEIQKKFREDWNGFEYLQGSSRSMSAGILITYYKEPLYIAVRKVAELEHLAKESGRNAVAIGYRKHSGTYYWVVANWSVFSGEHLESFLKEMRNGKISRKLLYELDTKVWPNDPLAVLNLVKYEVSRHSSYRKDEKEALVDRFAEFLWIVRNIRVRIASGEVPGVDAGVVNDLVAEVIVDDPENPNNDSFEKIKQVAESIWQRRDPETAWFIELQNKLAQEFSEKQAKIIAGLVLKKQVWGASVLLKILLEAGWALW